MDLVWPLVIVLTVGMILSLVLAAGPRLVSGIAVRVRSFWCPFRDQNVRVQFDTSTWDNKLLDVRGCSAFTPATAVTCAKSCLRLPRFPPAK
ncbi:MAG: hypothetical protein HYR51_15555 [Candidatus Rokubacteria bacterium]|nr:hypothetical protein [Candidatus Rokubacteria bacterium]